MIKVSVIVPVFNVEPYIERCVRTLMEQTMDSIEYIFVNDATQDGSMAILNRAIDDYPSRKPYVKIVEHEVNKGLPTARHSGLMVASGEYIIHCDSDDYVDRDMYRQMYELAVDGDYDIVVSDYYEVLESEQVEKRGLSNSQNMILSVLSEQLSAVWNKMIRLSIAVDPMIVFPKDNMAEDLAQTIQHALLAKTVGHVEKPLYYYERRTSSILGDRRPQVMMAKTEQFVRNFDIAVAAIERSGRYDEFKEDILHEKVYIKNHLLPVLPFIPCYKTWKNTYKEVNSKVLFSRMFTLREKANFVITYLGLYPLYYKLTHRNA